MSVSLVDDVREFVDRIAVALGDLSGRGAGAHRADAAVEASDLVAALIDADGRQADAELRAYLEAVGPLLHPPLLMTPQRLREGRLLEDRRHWVETPSVLFDLLVRADARDGGARAHRYYELALGLAHLTAALDLIPSPSELVAIDDLRSTLLVAMDDAGVPRPGGAPPRGPVRARPAAAAVATDAPHEVTVAPPAPAEPLEALLAELDELVGLTQVKAEVRRLTSLLQVQRLRAERGLPVVDPSHHLVFTGNPGTGKTTVARLLSRILHTLGVVSRGHLVETDRADLVAGFVGQTALKTQERLESALGGTLLIDEAYALVRGGERDFGREAIDTLVKFMEDHRDDLSVVAAGYIEEMHDFVESNPGLSSRFTRTIEFPDYGTDELVTIFVRLGERLHYDCSDDALTRLRELVDAQPRGRGFGNARFVRNLFEASVARQAERLAPLTDPSDEQLCTFVAEDISAPGS
jgi:hypothetical protein